jgi:hypothetical protein
LARKIQPNQSVFCATQHHFKKPKPTGETQKKVVIPKWAREYPISEQIPQKIMQIFPN